MCGIAIGVALVFDGVVSEFFVFLCFETFALKLWKACFGLCITVGEEHLFGLKLCNLFVLRKCRSIRGVGTVLFCLGKYGREQVAVFVGATLFSSPAASMLLIGCRLSVFRHMWRIMVIVNSFEGY